MSDRNFAIVIPFARNYLLNCTFGLENMPSSKSHTELFPVRRQYSIVWLNHFLGRLTLALLL
jgi:hypothetical protein